MDWPGLAYYTTAFLTFAMWVASVAAHPQASAAFHTVQAANTRTQLRPSSTRRVSLRQEVAASDPDHNRYDEEKNFDDSYFRTTLYMHPLTI
eukprot:scaffold187694_cov26-Prasinocladus_malaysianus.AAC.1